MKSLHLAPRARPERDHGAVAGGRGLAIEWPAQPQRQLFAPCAAIHDPTAPGLRLRVRGARTTGMPQRREQRVIEALGPGRIVGAETDVAESQCCRGTSGALRRSRVTKVRG